MRHSSTRTHTQEAERAERSQKMIWNTSIEICPDKVVSLRDTQIEHRELVVIKKEETNEKPRLKSIDCEMMIKSINVWSMYPLRSWWYEWSRWLCVWSTSSRPGRNQTRRPVLIDGHQVKHIWQIEYCTHTHTHTYTNIDESWLQNGWIHTRTIGKPHFHSEKWPTKDTNICALIVGHKSTGTSKRSWLDFETGTGSGVDQNANTWWKEEEKGEEEEEKDDLLEWDDNFDKLIFVKKVIWRQVRRKSKTIRGESCGCKRNWIQEEREKVEIAEPVRGRGGGGGGRDTQAPGVRVATTARQAKKW